MRARHSRAPYGVVQVSFKELLERWRESAAAPRTAKTYTVRLPVDDAAQLAALADMFPGRAAEQLISELLGAALKEVAAAMPYVAGQRVISTDEQGDPIYEDIGPTPRFIELARIHRRELEAPPSGRTGSRPAAGPAAGVRSNAKPRTRAKAAPKRARRSRA
jgi:hypothetical protein